MFFSFSLIILDTAAILVILYFKCKLFLEYSDEFIMMEQQQLPYTPQYGDHGNVILNRKSFTTNNNPATTVFECSDIIFGEYEGYSQKLRAARVTEVAVMRKDLDKPLGIIKSFFAKVASIKQEHQFLLLRTEHFQITVDYYIKNRVVVRIGDPAFVLDAQKSQARLKATVVREENGLEWRRLIGKGEELSLGAVLEVLLHRELRDYNQVSYSGSEFSKEIFNIIQHHLIPMIPLP